MIAELLRSVVALFIIMDPFFSAIYFISISKNMDIHQRNKAIWTALGVAALLLFIFLFGGVYALNVLGISFNGFKIAGGVILLIMGVTTVLAINYSSKSEKIQSAAILIGTPLLSGPGALTTVIILSNDYGFLIPAIACLIVLLISYLILRYAHWIEKILGTEIMQIASKILGLLLAALAVDFIYAGVRGFLLGG